MVWLNLIIFYLKFHKKSTTLKLELWSETSWQVHKAFNTNANCSVSSPFVPNFFEVILFLRFKSAYKENPEKKINKIKFQLTKFHLLCTDPTQNIPLKYRYDLNIVVQHSWNRCFRDYVIQQHRVLHLEARHNHLLVAHDHALMTKNFKRKCKKSKIYFQGCICKICVTRSIYLFNLTYHRHTQKKLSQKILEYIVWLCYTIPCTHHTHFI